MEPLIVNGEPVDPGDGEGSLLELLRERLGLVSVKDGCSPQGQCGCCTVLVDGQARVACVTPVRRVAGRRITTLEGLDPATAQAWGRALCATGGSQCGFCTPGIVMRLEGLVQRAPEPSRAEVDRALSAHLCRCTGWQTIVEAVGLRIDPGGVPVPLDRPGAARRAALEGGTDQEVGVAAALGAGGFAADGVPPGALVAVPDRQGDWAVGETLAEALVAAGKVQGRRGTAPVVAPLQVPDGDWDLTLATSWVEPAYLEPDASWCEPGGTPADPLANGGAFGSKQTSPVTAAAARLADRHGRPVLALLPREEVVRGAPKRPPLAAGLRHDGTGVVRVVRAVGVADRIRSVLPDVSVEEVDVPGPPVSVALRAAGWAEAEVLRAGLAGHPLRVTRPDGGWAEAEVRDGLVTVRVGPGEVLDHVVLRSYCIGAAHMALGWVTSEGLAVAADGTVQDLTIRSFGILRAAEMPEVAVEVSETEGPARPVSDAVFAAVAAATWLHQGTPAAWPTGRPVSA